MKKLTEAEIKIRLQEWRNYKIAIRKKDKQIEKLKKNVIALEKRDREKDEIIKKQQTQIEELQTQLSELQIYLFGKSKSKKGAMKEEDQEGNEDDKDQNNDKPKTRKKADRDKASYQRALPDKKDITSTQKRKISKCPDCDSKLRRKTIVIFYEEDIPLPNEEQKLKTVTEYQVEKGYCLHCRKWHAAIKLPTSKVIIGDNVKIYICYLSILMRLSISQIKNLLYDTYHFKISSGEIVNILYEISEQIEPEFEMIKKRLREGKGIHMDETSWGAFWMWVAASVDTEDVLYLAGRSRGKGNAEEILGAHFKALLIVDGYPAYKNLEGFIQLCWAHIHRKLRDLAKVKTLSKTKQKYLKAQYNKLSKIYEDLRNYLKEDFDQDKRKKQKQKLLEKIRKFAKPNKKDPKKLKNLKIMLTEREDQWLTCMDFEGIPCDNNKAERMLRHFVIKRKISFGNKTPKGSRAFEINASVLMTFWKKYADSFFEKIMELNHPQFFIKKFEYASLRGLMWRFSTNFKSQILGYYFFKESTERVLIKGQ